MEVPDTATSPKRTLILDQAIEVFAREGYRNADVQVIADQAAVGKGTVYRNFASKEELFNAATFEVLVRLDQYMDAAMRGLDDPLEMLFAMGMAHTRFFEENSSYLEIFVQNRAEFRGVIPAAHREFHEQLIDRTVQVVARGMSAGQIRRQDARSVVMSLATVLYGTIMFGCYVADEFSLTQLGEQALRSFLRGIRADQAPSTGSGAC